MTPGPSPFPTSPPSASSTVAPVAAPIPCFTEGRAAPNRPLWGRRRRRRLPTADHAPATIALTSTLVLTDAAGAQVAAARTGKLIEICTARLIDITGTPPSSRRRLGLDEATVSSEVRLKHLELICATPDDGPAGGAVRVRRPASLYAHDVTFTANSPSAAARSTCTRRSRGSTTAFSEEQRVGGGRRRVLGGRRMEDGAWRWGARRRERHSTRRARGGR